MSKINPVRKFWKFVYQNATFCTLNAIISDKARERSDRAGEGVSPSHGRGILEILCIKMALFAY